MEKWAENATQEKGVGSKVTSNHTTESHLKPMMAAEGDTVSSIDHEEEVTADQVMKLTEEVLHMFNGSDSSKSGSSKSSKSSSPHPLIDSSEEGEPTKPKSVSSSSSESEDSEDEDHRSSAKTFVQANARDTDQSAKATYKEQKKMAIEIPQLKLSRGKIQRIHKRAQKHPKSTGTT